LFTFLVITVSCEKLIDEFYLTDEIRQQIPFNGKEEISFINNNGDETILIAGDRVDEIHKEFDCINCKDYYYIETEKIQIKNELYEIGLELIAADQCSLSIRFALEDINFGCVFANLPLSENSLKHDETYYDSLIINNKAYYEIYGDTLLHHEGNIPINPYPTLIFYSTNFGVVKIDFSDGSYWELDKVDW